MLLSLPLIAASLGAAQVIKTTHQEYQKWLSANSDGALDHDARFASLEHLLPSHGRVGYVDPDHAWTDAAATLAFYRSQYALAPRVLVYGTGPDYVVYSSHRGRPVADDRIPEGFEIVAELAPDLAVLRRVP